LRKREKKPKGEPVERGRGGGKGIAPCPLGGEAFSGISGRKERKNILIIGSRFWGGKRTQKASEKKKKDD